MSTCESSSGLLSGILGAVDAVGSAASAVTEGAKRAAEETAIRVEAAAKAAAEKAAGAAAGLGAGLGLGAAAAEAAVAAAEPPADAPITTRSRAAQVQADLEARTADGRPLLAPELHLTVWDYDRGPLGMISDPDDLVGLARLSLRAATLVPCDGRPRDRQDAAWLKLGEIDHEGGDGGEVMVRVELVQLSLSGPQGVSTAAALSTAELGSARLSTDPSRHTSSRDLESASALEPWTIDDDRHEPDAAPPPLRNEAGLPLHPSAVYPPVPITPPFEWRVVSVAVLGLQGLRSGTVQLPSWLGKNAYVDTPCKPFVEVDAGLQAGGGGTRAKGKEVKADGSQKSKLSFLGLGRSVRAAQRLRAAGGKGASMMGVRSGAQSLLRTAPSDTPSANAPCFFEVLELRLNLPTDHLFLPSINVRVYDTQFGGMHTPMLGYASIDLRDYTPGEELRASADEMSLLEALDEDGNGDGAGEGGDRGGGEAHGGEGGGGGGGAGSLAMVGAEAEQRREEAKLRHELMELVKRKIQILDEGGRSEAQISDALVKDAFLLAHLPVHPSEQFVEHVLANQEELPELLVKLKAPGSCWRLLCRASKKTLGSASKVTGNWKQLLQATKLSQEEIRLNERIRQVRGAMGPQRALACREAAARCCLPTLDSAGC